MAYPSTPQNARKLLLPCFDESKAAGVEAWDRLDEESCLLRAQYLMKPMKSFIQQTRVYEGTLSKAQCEDGRQLEPGTHNYTVHMTARANYEHNMCQTRVSRHAAWAFHLEKVEQKLHKDTPTTQSGADPTEFRPTVFRPSSVTDQEGTRQYQILLYQFEGDLRIGVTEEVYRGAATKQSKKTLKQTKKAEAPGATARLMRTSKPVGFELKARVTSKIKLIQLDLVEDRTWATSNVRPGHLIDPYETGTLVLCEFPVLDVITCYPKLTLRMARSVSKTVERFRVGCRGLNTF